MSGARQISLFFALRVAVALLMAIGATNIAAERDAEDGRETLGSSNDVDSNSMSGGDRMSESKVRDIVRVRRLHPGGTIGVIAPGSPVTLQEETIRRAYDRLRALGFTIIEASQCRTVRGHTAGSAEERARAIHCFLEDPKVDAIMSFWGGYQTHQILEHLDFQLFARHPKPIIGYSDMTALTVAVHARTGVVTFSGPAVITFAKPDLPSYTWDVFSKVLIEGQDQVVLHQSGEFSDNPWFAHPEGLMVYRQTPAWRALRGGVARGPLLAGNLGVLLLLSGTSYWPDLRGRILVVEEDEVETPETIDRMFTQLRQIGVFDQIAGLAVGRLPSAVRFTDDDTLDSIVMDATRGYNFPIVVNLDYGHTDPLLTLPLGVDAQLDAELCSLILLERGVE